MYPMMLDYVFREPAIVNRDYLINNFSIKDFDQNLLNLDLMTAAFQGKDDLIKSLINRGANVNAVMCMSNPIVEACKSGNISAVKILLSAGADIHLTKDLNNTPLIASINSQNITELNEFILGKCVDINIIKQGANAISSAIGRNNKALFTRIIEVGAMIDIQPNNQKYKEALIYSALMVAAQHSAEACKILIDCGVNIDAINNNGSAIIVAVFNNKIRSVQLLIDSGAALNLTDKDGNTALIYAVRFNLVEIALLLINAGADLNQKNRSNNSAITSSRNPLIKAAIEIKMLEKVMIEHLIKEPAIVNTGQVKRMRL